MSPLPMIERYLRRTEMPPTKFGRLAVNDPRLVGDIKRGRHIGAKLTARIAAFIAADQA